MRKLILLGVTGVGFWIAYALLNPPADGIRFFDVGQGDAALVSSGQTQLLIDGGPDRSVLAELGAVMPLLDRQIEFVVLSHPHTDHYRGLIEIVKRYRVKTLIVGVPGKESEYQAFITTARQRGTNIVPAAGQSISISPAIHATIISPTTALPDKPVEDPNNASVVLTVTAGASRVLMTGDAGFEEEKRLLASGQNLNADILKVGHHGSKTSSSEEFLAAVTPRDAVISSGEGNKYGHPTADALGRLTNIHAKIYRTDQHGTITMKFDATGYRLIPDK